MHGSELRRRREALGYTQIALAQEWGLKSRQTLAAWEKSPKVSRLVEHALLSLENFPEIRSVAGESCPPWTRRKLDAREAQNLLRQTFSSGATVHKEMEIETSRASLIDCLTGLYSRRGFEMLLQKERVRS